MDAEHLEGMSTHEEPSTTTLHSALHDEAAALHASSDQVIPGISEENVNAEMALDPELGQMHETDHRDDLFYDPSVDQSGSNQFMMPGEMDNKVSGHVTQNINDMAAPTPLATVPVEHQSLIESENDVQQQNQQNEDEEEQENKRRRVQRACDACRRKKIRCDGAQAGKRNITCSNCLEQKVECTYVEAAKRRGPPPGYIEALEWKVQKFEDLLARVKPEINLLQVVGPSITRDSFDLNDFTQSLSENGIDYMLQTGRARATKTLAVSERSGSARKGKNPAMHLPNRSTTLANAIEPPPSFPVHSQAEVDAVMGLLGHGGPHDPMDPRTGRHVESLIDRSGRMDERARSHSVLDPSLVPSSIVGKDIGSEDSASANYQARIKEAEEAQENHNHEFSLEVQNNFPEEGYRYHGKSYNGGLFYGLSLSCVLQYASYENVAGIQLLRTIVDYQSAEGSDTPQQSGKKFAVNISQSRRAAYWAIPMWEAVVSETKTEPLDLSRWPEPDLAQQLIDAYFATDNLILPLLNRVMLQKAYDTGVWKSNHRFAKVCLLVFANAAKSVDDPRVYWYSGDPRNEREAYKNPDLYKHSAGWRWVQTVMQTGRSWLSVTALEDLQCFVLFANFCFRSAVISTVWTVGGFGLKSCVDIGIHTKAGYSRTTDKAEKELLKRAFWCLIYIDTYSSAAMGRSLQMSAEDYDVDYPLEVDDDFWDTGDPATDFVQPVDRPSRISVFVCLLKLVKVINRSMKVIYPVNRDATSQDSGVKAQGRIIAELDSSLFAWLDSVPAHLRWDPQRTDSAFFEQSCVLYSYYYFAQILIHRPFIPSPGAVQTLALPSLAICTNAARSCAHIAELQVARMRPNYHILLPAFTSAIVLLMNVWASKKTGRPQDSEVNLREVRKCVHALRDAEPWWRGAGRMRDILMELSSISDTSLQTPTRYSSHTTTPVRQQTFEPESSSLRRESYRAASPPNGRDGIDDMIQPKIEEQPLPATDVNVEPSLASENPLGNPTGYNDAPSQPWFAPNWNQPNPSTLPYPVSGPSALQDHPLVRDMTTPRTLTENPMGGLYFGSPSLGAYHPMFNGINAGESSGSRPMSQSGPPPAYQDQGQIPENQSACSNAAMLNGMYSLLSGNIHNLQLPEYQHWLHNVSQNQQLPPAGALNIPPTNFSSAIPNTNQLPLGNLQGADAQGMANGQWNNFDLGLGLDSALDVNGAMTDIWSMAPNNFEMDEWSRYLSQAQPPSGSTPADPRQ